MAPCTQDSSEREPRVVVFEGAEEVTVEVFSLPVKINVGAAFERDGTRWTITGDRPRSRVLFARHLAAESG